MGAIWRSLRFRGRRSCGISSPSRRWETMWRFSRRVSWRVSPGLLFRCGVKRGCAVVEDKQFRVCEQCPCEERRCRCPPESDVPLCPTRVSYWTGISRMKSCICAAFAASMICLLYCVRHSVADIVSHRSKKICASWGTMPTAYLSETILISLRSIPSMVICPWVGS